ncbi:MAG: ATP-binding protein [Velocimicrobium sp.]
MLGQLPFKIDFELAAIVIFIITMVYTYSGKTLPNLVNQIYKIMIGVAFATTLLDLATVFSIGNSLVIPIEVNYVLNYCYLFLQNMMTPILFLYVYLLTEEKEREWTFYLYLIPLLVILMSFLVTPMTGFIFYFDEAKMYCRGAGMKVLYIASFVYLILSMLFIIKYRKSLKKNQRFAIAFFIMGTIVALIIQKIWPHVLLGGFSTAISSLIIYISLQNPEDKIDYTTGIFNRTAAITMISDYLKQKESFAMVVLAIDQFSYINEKYGFEMGDGLLKTISKFLIGIAPNCVYRLDGDNIAIVFEPDLISIELVIEEILRRFQSEWAIGDDNVKLSTCICCISCPQDAQTVTEVLDTINNTINDAKEIGGGTIIYASEHIDNREKRIGELEEQKRLLENISKEAEAARIEAERADRTKSTFLANMSHEIRTPMNAILGMTELVLRDEVTNQVRENVENIKSAGQSLLAIINDILDISKIESGKLEIVNDRYFLSSIIHDITNMLCSRMRDKKIEFILEVDHNLPNELLGDELRIRQILLNLLTNAVKFTAKGYVLLRIKGDIEAEYVNLHISVEDTGFGMKPDDLAKLFESFVRLDRIRTRQIEGTGLGLAICKQLLNLMEGEIYVESQYEKGSTFYVNLRQKIFSKDSIIEVVGKELIKPLVILKNESDKQLMNVLKNLDINAVYEVEAESVWTLLQEVKFSHIFMPYDLYQKRKPYVDSLSKKEKVIIVTEYGQYVESVGWLSAIQKPVYCINVGDALNGALQTKIKKDLQETFIAPEASILIVDDNAVNLKVAEGLLKPYQMKVSKALSARECLALVKDNYYDLILLDHMMPEMDGVEVLSKIRAIKGEYYKQVKVIALTANAIRGIREMYLESGFTDYISKPIDIGRLDEVLSKHLPHELIKEDKFLRKKSQDVFPYKIKNVNTEEGIGNCSGSLKLYFELLHTVLLEGNKKHYMMKEYIATENIKSYMVEVHSLKSVAASIGANPLSMLAKKHEEEAKAGNDRFIKRDGEHLLMMYKELLDSIEHVLKLQETEESFEEENKIFIGRVEEKFEEVYQLVSNYEDEKAIVELDSLKKANLTSEQKDKVLRVIEAVKILDYREALKILSRKQKVVEDDKTRI